MIAFIGRSIVQKIVTLFFVSIVSFAIIHLAPGEPSQVDPLNPKFTPEMVERFRTAFHLDQPLYVQYAYFYRDLFTRQHRLLEGQPAGAQEDLGALSEQPAPFHRRHPHHLDHFVSGGDPLGHFPGRGIRPQRHLSSPMS